MLKKMFLIFGLLLVSNNILSMESTPSIEEPLSQSIQGIILLSSDNKEFVVNEEAIGNSALLKIHKGCNNKKVPLCFNSEVVGFLAIILNDPLHQDDLLQNKIKELQEAGNNFASLEQYTIALKEFDISVWQVVHDMPSAPVPMRMVNHPEDADLYESSCCTEWKCVCSNMRLNTINNETDFVCCSFSVIKLFKNCCFCIVPFCCREKDGNCYIHLMEPL